MGKLENLFQKTLTEIIMVKPNRDLLGCWHWHWPLHPCSSSSCCHCCSINVTDHNLSEYLKVFVSFLKSQVGASDQSSLGRMLKPPGVCLEKKHLGLLLTKHIHSGATHTFWKIPKWNGGFDCWLRSNSKCLLYSFLPEVTSFSYPIWSSRWNMPFLLETCNGLR